MQRMVWEIRCGKRESECASGCLPSELFLEIAARDFFGFLTVCGKVYLCCASLTIDVFLWPRKAVKTAFWQMLIQPVSCFFLFLMATP